MKDKFIRDKALDCSRSFFIKAPAGSGKTTLLTKRFISLTKITTCEKILALTFTKKAAFEMQSRIESKVNLPGKALNITTIDSFTLNLLQTYGNLNFNYELKPHPELMYKNATNRFLAKIPADVLAFFDKSIFAMQKLCIDLLAKREQWLPFIFNQDGKKYLAKRTEKLNAQVKDLLNEYSINLPSAQFIELIFTKTMTVRKRLPKDTPCRQEISYALESISDEQIQMLTEYFYLINIKEQVTAYPSFIKVLPILVAELMIEFDQQRAFDFIEVNLKALSLIQENPDISLAFMQQYDHILIDEVQDTSKLHFDIITLLLKEWHRPKTLFLVGDPMQSIYGFRQANIQKLPNYLEKLANLDLQHLTLTSNFRTSKNIVNTINQGFSQIYKDSFSASEAMVNTTGNIKLVNTNQIASLINPKLKTGILAPTKASLIKVAKELDAKKIEYLALDLQSLHVKTMDLFCISKVLHDPSDRLYWFSLLRSPLIGFNLHTLYELSSFEDIFLGLKTLKFAGKERLAPVFEYLKQGITTNLAYDTAKVWYALNGHLLIDFSYAFAYFELLEQHSLDELEAILPNELVSKALNSSKVELMTAHKAKGLEFDQVILVDFDKPVYANKLDLLHWHEVDDTALLALKHKNDPFSMYVSYKNSIAKQQEDIRLLYVALTRAKHDLYICLQQKSKQSTLMTHLDKFNLQCVDKPNQQEIEEVTYKPKVLAKKINPKRLTNLVLTGNSHFKQELFGEFMHKIIEAKVYQHQTINYNNLAMSLDVPCEFLPEFIQKGQELLLKLIKSSIGNFIFTKHEQDESEKPLNHEQSLRVDRTFVYENQRYIIDYKTGKLDMLAYTKQMLAYKRKWYKLFNEHANTYILHVEKAKLIAIS